MLIVGESLNASIPGVGKAVMQQHAEAIIGLARHQAECGAHMLDLNAAVTDRDETEDLAWMVRTVQSAVDLPLMLDSSNPDALKAALAVHEGPPPVLSSVTNETGSVEALLPLALERGCALVALCMDDDSISPDPLMRFEIAQKLIDRITGAGLPAERLFIDPMVMTIGTDTESGLALLRLVRMLREHHPRIRTLCGASNVSFGMPQRKLLNRTFVSMLAAAGMEGFLVNVRDRSMMATLLAAAALVGEDKWCRNYIRAHRDGKLEAPVK